MGKFTVLLHSLRVTLVLALVFGATMSYLLVGRSSAATPVTYYVSQTGSDSNTCTVTGAACKTINAAYQKATGGDTVLLLNSLSTSQTFNTHTALTSDVTIKPANGVTVTIPSINWCGADNVNLQGTITTKTLTNYSCLDSEAKNVTIDGLIFDYQYDTSATDGSVLGLYGNVKDWLIKNVTITRGYNVKGFYLSSWGVGNTVYYPTNVTLENSTVHEWDVSGSKLPSTGDYVHTECFFVNKVQTLTLRGNHFYNCVSTGDGIIGNAGSDPLQPSNFLFENNIFEASWDGPSSPGASVGLHGVAVDGRAEQMSGVNIFRYNIFERPIFTSPTKVPSSVTVEFYGNVGMQPPCAQMTRSDYNVWVLDGGNDGNHDGVADGCGNASNGSPVMGGHDYFNSDVLTSANFVGFPTRPGAVVMPAQVASGNWRPKGSSAMQVGKGNPASTCSAAGALGAGSSPCYPAKDKDGNTRSGTIDAGPYQYSMGGGGLRHVYSGADLENLRQHYGQTTGMIEANGDLNSDGAVNVYDLGIMLVDYEP